MSVLRRWWTQHQRLAWCLLLSALLIIYGLWQVTLLYCNDAYVQSNIVTITAQSSGYIQQIPVPDNATVQAKQLLLKIDPTPFQLKLQALYSEAEEAKAHIAVLTFQQKIDLEKYKALKASYGCAAPCSPSARRPKLSFRRPNATKYPAPNYWHAYRPRR